MLGRGEGNFGIDSSTGQVKLTRPLDFEDPRQPHMYQLQVTASEESGALSTTVPVRWRELDSISGTFHHNISVILITFRIKVL